MRRRMVIAKKKKKKSLSSLKKELWRYFSTYIKHRDNWRCFTCNSFVSGQNAHAGHFVPSSVGGISLRYNEDNVHCQCYRCNIHLGGNYVTYRERMVGLYGEKKVREIEQSRHNITKDFDYEEAITTYKHKLEGVGVQLH